MAAVLGCKVARSTRYKLVYPVVSVPKIFNPRSYSSLGYRSYVISSSLAHKTLSIKFRSPVFTSCRHLTVGDKLIPVHSNHIESELASHDLGGWGPTGIVQQALEWLHVSAGLPWWASIAVGTIIARALMSPLFVMAQRNAINMNNNLPQMQVLQMKITEARKDKNMMEAAQYTNEMLTFMQEKNCNPFKSMLVPIAQAPVFLSFYFALRQMSNVPIDSFKYGGMLWFPDLTLTDPYYLLPVITCATLFIVIELNAAGKMRTNVTKSAQNILRALPVVIFPFLMYFPTAVLCYWVTSNGMTLIQIGLLKFPKVRQLFKIPERIPITQHSLPVMAQESFMESFEEVLTNTKITREMQSRKQADHLKLQRSGMKTIAKSHKSDSENTKDS